MTPVPASQVAPSSLSSNKNSGYARVRRLTQKDQQQNCSVHSRASSSLKNPQCSAVGEAEVSSDLQSSFHSRSKSGHVIESPIRSRQRTSHVGRLCCSRAPQAALPGAPLDCSNVTHCSAAWSRLRPATLLPLSEQQQKRPVRATDKPPNPKKETPEAKRTTNYGHDPTPAREKGRRQEEGYKKP